jgi:hypothetical protein
MAMARLIMKAASKLLATVILSLLIAPATMALNTRMLARINAMSADQLLAHERHVLGHGLAYHCVVFTFSLLVAVAIIDGASWCIRAQFLHWTKQARNAMEIAAPNHLVDREI